MNGGVASQIPSFGLHILAPVTLVLLIATIFAARKMHSWPGRFVLFALWARYLFGAYHVFMFKPLAAGLSGNAFASITFAGLGLLVIRLRHLMLTALLPIYLLISLVLLSGILNNDMTGAFGVAIKYAYLTVVIVATFEALRQDEEGKVMPWLLWAFAPLLLFQWLSLAMNMPKGSEEGTGLVWIGGFNHEAAFSLALATAFMAGCLARKLHPGLRIGFMIATLVGIFLAGYRTAIFAVGPLAFMAAWGVLTDYVKPEQRRAVGTVALVVVMAAAAAVAVAYHEKFVDLATFLSDPGSLIKQPREFTQLDRQIMSGRPLIWSQYLYAYADGTPVQHLFGFGAESWTDTFNVYPHNTLVGTLYELGMFGVGAMLILWFSMLLLAVGVRRTERMTLIAAHLSFIIMNFATMPFWQVEGLAFYGLLCGYTLFSARAAALSRGAARSGSSRAPYGNRRVRPGIRQPQSDIPHSRYSHQ
ncbi:hypothetical protein [Rhizorhapis suberifaciens]|uniref:O-antigen ligase family protein n=1 Tax=Rhizorhapis suberifaciens TaxID=13656 RepID=A0A840HRN6_9SPHN|nr:hypothetical protein [Rhizorhapis suberifaciens]MBB4640204.1 hypothetical protein [Rhizorhapis suberifaciens]